MTKRNLLLWLFTVLAIYVGMFVVMLSAQANDTQWGIVYDREPRVPIPSREWSVTTKTWLGRSCVGEAGFENYHECIAIAWVYATRWREVKGASLEQVIKKYSAAIKSKSTHRRPWILDLNIAGVKPAKWPSSLSWRVHRPLWLRILSELDHWAAGNRPNPVPTANHYGGPMDKPRGAWVRISPRGGRQFGNTFYRSPF